MHAAFDESAFPAIEAELGVRFEKEPYRVPSGDVYGAELEGENGAVSRIILWPSIHRVDVSMGACRIVFKQVTGLQVFERIEVVFHRDDGGHLFITRAGQVNVAV